jgi:hypothetical protein
VPGKVIAQLMGHAKVDTTLNVYTQVIDGSLRRAVDTVGSELFTIVHNPEETALGHPPKAITAMAHKLARLVYRMLTWGHGYVDKGLQYYEERHREQHVQLLKKRAAKLGLQIVEPEAA